MRQIHGMTIENVVAKVLPTIMEPHPGTVGMPFREKFSHMRYNQGHVTAKLEAFVRRMFDTDERVKPISSSGEAMQRADLSLLFRYAVLGRYFSGFHDHTLVEPLIESCSPFISHLDSFDIRRREGDEKSFGDLGEYTAFSESTWRLAEQIFLQQQALGNIYRGFICRDLTDWNPWDKKKIVIPDTHPVKQTNEFVALGKLFQSYMQLVRYALTEQIDIDSVLKSFPWAKGYKRAERKEDNIRESLQSLIGLHEFADWLTASHPTSNGNLYEAATGAAKMLLKRKEIGCSMGKTLDAFIEQMPTDTASNINLQDLTAAVLNLVYDYHSSLIAHNVRIYDAFRRKHRIKRYSDIPDRLKEEYEREVKPFYYSYKMHCQAGDNVVSLEFEDYHPPDTLLNKLTARMLEQAGCTIVHSSEGIKIDMPVRKASSSLEVYEPAKQDTLVIQELYHDSKAAHADKSVLLVEDDTRFLVPMVSWMQSLGIGSIYTARNLADAVRIYETQEFDAIVLDVNLPSSAEEQEVVRFLGMELAKKADNIPIIYSTAASQKEIKHQALKLEIDAEQKDIQRSPFAIAEKGLRNSYIDAVANLLSLERPDKSLPKTESTANPAYLGKKVLIVEDQEGFLTTLENILVSMGIPNAQIYKARNGREAVELLQKNPDTALTITDLRMPEIDGMQFLSIYASTFKDQRPIIVVTGSYSNEEVASIFQAQNLDELHLNLRYTIKGRFFSGNIRRLVASSLTQPATLADVQVKMPDSLDALPRVHTLEHLEELAALRKGELYTLETNRQELANLLEGDDTAPVVRELRTDFAPPKSIKLADQHDYKTEIAAILVDNEERVRTLEATVKGRYEHGAIDMSRYARILSHLSLIDQATQHAFQYTVEIVRHLAEVDEIAYSETDLSHLIEKELVPEFQKRYSGVAFKYDTSSLPKLSTSQKALSDALRAILDNAASYGSEVSVSARSEDGSVVIEVVDNGPGINGSIANRIFDPMFTTRAESGGTGVGLSLAKSYISRLGGQLEYIPQEHGACFRIRLAA